MQHRIITIVRSIIFNISFFVWSMGAALLFAPLFIISSRATLWVGAPWAKVSLWLARIICGITYEVRGKQHMRPTPVIYASKHQSAWDTLIFHILLKYPAYVLKRELLRIPLWGWYLWRMKMIAIDRSAGSSSIKSMVRQSRNVTENQRAIVIFPEGTRTKVGAPPQYHPGIVALYSQLKCPIVPVALNSGCVWGKNAFMKYPGKIIIEFLPPINVGLSKKEILPNLQETIEQATMRLINETQQADK